MPLWKTKSGYRIQFQHEGRRYSKSGFPTQKAAERWQVEKLRDLEQESRTPPTVTSSSVSDSGPLTLGALMVEYLRGAERILAPVTLRYRKTVFRRFLNHLGDMPVAGISMKMVENYLLLTPTNNQYNKERTELMVLFTWGHKRLSSQVPSNPIVLVDKLGVDQKKKIIPTAEEMKRIILAAGKDRPLILVLFHTLARIDEVLRLKWDDVNWGVTKYVFGPGNGKAAPGNSIGCP